MSDERGGTEGSTAAARDAPRVLVTGATGYVGARLLARLEREGVPVRVLARRPEAVRGGAPTTEVVRGDVLDAASLDAALSGINVAYYLVHSMGSSGGFAEQDRRAAERFGDRARAAGVERIVYLGGLGHGKDLSDHLASRQETGRILAAHVPTVEFRAGIVIGSGSLSFDALNALVRRLPVMLAPRWVSTPTQPIAIDDVIAYLFAARDPVVPPGIYEIGGPRRLSYEDLMQECARLQGLRRHIIKVPVLTPRLSSLWLGLVTPVYARVARKMIDGLRNETVVQGDVARRVFPHIRPVAPTEAIAAALADADQPASRWSDAVSSAGQFRTSSGTPLKRQLVDSRWVHVNVPPQRAFAPIQRIGGRSGWYFGNGLWTLRGLLDLGVGGVGTRRGRRHPVLIQVGDTVDFWRVEAFEPDRLLRLRAEMRLPGAAWLQFRVEPRAGGAFIRQTAFYEPAGAFGHLYWLAMAPFHAQMFRGMLKAIADMAEGHRPMPGPPA